MVRQLRLVEEDEIVEQERNVISAEQWNAWIFCGECLTPWTGLAPCGECGRYARPVAATSRRVITGKVWAPWTWSREYEISEDVEMGRDGPELSEYPGGKVAQGGDRR